MIANENLSNVFRISVILKHDIVPNLLQQALQDTLPMFKGFKVKLKRGFFWYDFEGNKRTPYIEKETSWPCRYIDLEQPAVSVPGLLLRPPHQPGGVPRCHGRHGGCELHP